mmetsp:Transcript_12194/g.30714  ORF Transcript_12194/g.30714 Transcript_12194/m.30714 type:complete len:240 (+) Transcript_12194:2360-3079(+)
MEVSSSSGRSRTCHRLKSMPSASRKRRRRGEGGKRRTEDGKRRRSGCAERRRRGKERLRNRGGKKNRGASIWRQRREAKETRARAKRSLRRAKAKAARAARARRFCWPSSCRCPASSSCRSRSQGADANGSSSSSSSSPLRAFMQPSCCHQRHHRAWQQHQLAPQQEQGQRVVRLLVDRQDNDSVPGAALHELGALLGHGAHRQTAVLPQRLKPFSAASWTRSYNACVRPSSLSSSSGA